MVSEGALERLSLLSTCWSLVCRARQRSTPAVQAAQRTLLERYGPAIRRYLRGAVRDENASEDLYQEFALRLVQGDLDGAKQERGRFRDYVKGVLVHLIADFYNRRKHDALLHRRVAERTAAVLDAEDAPTLQDAWRDQVLHLAWAALARLQTEGRPLLYTVLRYRAAHSQLRSPALAQVLSHRLGRPVKAASVRQLVHRAREKFAELLLSEVAEALDGCTYEELVSELEELRLLRYCQPALEKWSESADALSAGQDHGRTDPNGQQATE